MSLLSMVMLSMMMLRIVMGIRMGVGGLGLMINDVLSYDVLDMVWREQAGYVGQIKLYES